MVWMALARAVGLAAAGQAVVGGAKWAFKRPVKGTPLPGQEPPQLRQEGSSRWDKLEHFFTSGRLVNGLYAVDATLRMAGRVAGIVKPTFYHHVVVGVKGGPRATMTRTWQLACSLAFGQMRNSVGFASDYAIDCTWDITKKAVQITTGYQLGWQAWLGAREFIRRGPISSTVGGAFPRELGPILGVNRPNQQAQNAPGGIEGFLDDLGQIAVAGFGGNNPVGGQEAGLVGVRVQRVVGGRVVKEGDGGANAAAIRERQNALIVAGLAGQFDILPDDGRLILTESKEIPNVQPYRPTDYGDLVSLVANALTAPGFLPTPPPDGPRDGDSVGEYLYNPGEKVRDSVLNGKVQKVEQPPANAVGVAIGGLIGRFIGAAVAVGYGLDKYIRRGRGQTVPAVQGPRHPEVTP